MRVLVACEFTGIVRDAFLAEGFDAMSCDLLETESRGPHYTGDVRDILGDGWDVMIAHPPCTHLAVSGRAWFKNKQKEQREGLEFVKLLMDAPIKHIAIENPVGVISTKIRQPDQYIQPWQFGHGVTKKTGLWLKFLPVLQPTNIVSGREEKAQNASRTTSTLAKMARATREMMRSRFYTGIADAMARQWGAYVRKYEKIQKSKTRQS